MEPGASFKFRYVVTDADTAAALKPITGEVMRGRHQRAVIDEARLLEGAARRR
jgi:hypothetical protein